MKQFDDFQRLVKNQGNMFRLDVRGPGLISHSLITGAHVVIEEQKAA